MPKEKPKKNLWQEQIEEILANVEPLNEEEVEDDLPPPELKALGLIVVDADMILPHSKVRKFMKLYQSMQNEMLPGKRWRYFFEHMAMELSQMYPPKETAILLFKAGQLYEKYKDQLEGGETD